MLSRVEIVEGVSDFCARVSIESIQPAGARELSPGRHGGSHRKRMSEWESQTASLCSHEYCGRLIRPLSRERVPACNRWSDPFSDNTCRQEWVFPVLMTRDTLNFRQCCVRGLAPIGSFCSKAWRHAVWHRSCIALRRDASNYFMRRLCGKSQLTDSRYKKS